MLVRGLQPSDEALGAGMTIYENGRTVYLPIEKGIPITPSISPFKESSPVMETARSMEVGDSFVLPEGCGKQTPGNMARATGFKFTQRKQPDGSIRVWRIA